MALIRMYKGEADEGNGMTNAQRETYKKIRASGIGGDAAHLYRKACMEENLTDEWRERERTGAVEGAGVWDDF